MALEGGALAGAWIGGLLAGILLLALLLFLFRMFMQGAQCSSKARLDGKIVAITGCNTGIGKFTALDMSRRGAKVVMLCRNVEAAETVAEEIRKETEGEVIVHRCDLASLKSVRECAEQLSNSLEKIDILINNAGVMTCPLTRTEDGFEMQIGTNHLGHFLLTNLVMPLVKKAAPGARIVNVSSLAHESGVMQWDDLNWNTTPYSPIKAYSQSKLANVLFTKELARRGEGSGVTVYSLHPGVIATDLGRHARDTFGPIGSCMMAVAKPFIRTVESGAQTTIYCAVDEKIAEHNGRYYSDCKEKSLRRHAESAEDAKRLWDVSEGLTGLGQN